MAVQLVSRAPFPPSAKVSPTGGPFVRSLQLTCRDAVQQPALMAHRLSTFRSAPRGRCVMSRTVPRAVLLSTRGTYVQARDQAGCTPAAAGSNAGSMSRIVALRFANDWARCPRETRDAQDSGNGRAVE